MPSFGWGGSTRGLGTLIAVMMRYPEVSAVQCDPEANTMSITFILPRAIEETLWQGFSDQLQEVLGSYRDITGRPLHHLELNRTEFGDVTSIELRRDTKTVSVEEVGMAIEVLRDAFDGGAIADPHDLLEEEMMLQEETIQERLADLIQHGCGQLVALRDEGRVVVFNT